MSEVNHQQLETQIKDYIRPYTNGMEVEDITANSGMVRFQVDHITSSSVFFNAYDLFLSYQCFIFVQNKDG